jgi:hypothetical protein
MLPYVFLLAISATGINYGWEPIQDGGMRYIVQFEPNVLAEAQKTGYSLESNIPSHVHDVRAISIRIGTGEVPKKIPPINPELQFPNSNQEKDTQKSIKTPAQPASVASDLKESQEKLSSGTGGSTEQQSVAKPWTLLGVLILLSCCSIGGNVYLLWIYAELRKRFRTMLA